jgi:hypothetical protein
MPIRKEGQMAVTSATDDQRAAQLLKILYEYVVSYFPSHPILLPAVVGLREAAEQYGSRRPQQAFQKAADVYQFLVRIRSSNPDLPLP